MMHVYLSPHLDDAVLSCGGALHRHGAAGESSLVITVFTAECGDSSLSPFAQLQHRSWGNWPKPMTLRRAEDRAALTLLGAEVRHLDYLDAVYRVDARGGWLYTDLQTLMGEVHPADELAGDGTRALAEQLAVLAPRRPGLTLYAPLGVGHHVDHQIVHLAAKHLVRAGYRVAFYEDYPYAERPGMLEAAFRASGPGEWQLEAVRLDVADLAAKVSALGYYRSQLPSLFGGAEEMPNRVWAFGATRLPEVDLSERMWWPK